MNKIECGVCNKDLTEDKFKIVLVHKNVTKEDVGISYYDCELEMIVCNSCSENLNFRILGERVKDD